MMKFKYSRIPLMGFLLLHGHNSTFKLAEAAPIEQPTGVDIDAQPNEFYPGVGDGKRLPLLPTAPTDDTLSEFTEPLVKLLSSNQSTPTDLTKLLQSLPDILVSIPGVGNLDVNKLPPWMVEHVLRGGQLPGVKKGTLDAIVRQYMQRVYVAALHELGREPAPEEKLPPLPKGVDPKSYLRPVTELPQRFVTSVLQGHPLPHLSAKQTQVIKDYYVKDMPILAKMFDATETADVTKIFSPKVLAMIKLMPPGFDYTKLPPEVFKSVMEGEVPDLSQLPPDLQEHLKKNLDHVFNALSSSTEISMDEVLDKMPTFESPPQQDFSPYDINTVDSGAVVGNVVNKNLDEEAIRLYIIAGLGGIGLLTLTAIAVALYRIRCAKKRGDDGSSEYSSTFGDEDACPV